MLGFRKTDLIADALFIGLAVVTSWIIGYTPLIEDSFLSLFLKYMVYLVDGSVCMATFIGLSSKGPLLVFYLFRIVALVYS